MNYANHSLKTDLEKWTERLRRAPFSEFGQQLKYFMNNLDSNIQLHGVLNEVVRKYEYAQEELNRLEKKRDIDLIFDNQTHQAAFCYQLLLNLIKKEVKFNIHESKFFQTSEFVKTKSNIIESYIMPIVNFLQDKLDKSSSIIYLLEKYKKRTEWFTKKELCDKYRNSSKNFEQIFEDDLRLFLFDQGVDYPFSTPASASGRADIVGEIDTEDPLIIEIKIFDSAKKYGKKRIMDGFSQIVKYVDDYHKNTGYLVIFNLDEAELNFKFSENSNVFPPVIKFKNKLFYVIVINLSLQKPASKIGKLPVIEVTEEELTELIKI